MHRKIDPQILGSGCYLSKLMVSNSLRGMGASHHLLRYLYKWARDYKGVNYQISHCHPKLVPVYKKMGLRCFGSVFYDDFVGEQIPMVLLLSDREYLKKCKSYLYYESLKYPFNKDDVLRQRDFFGV